MCQPNQQSFTMPYDLRAAFARNQMGDMTHVSEADSDLHLAVALTRLGPIPAGNRQAVIQAVINQGWCGMNGNVTEDQQRLFDLIAGPVRFTSYEEVARSKHRKFILALSTLPDGLLMINYIKNVARFAEKYCIDLGLMLELCKKTQFNYDMQMQRPNPMSGLVRRQVFGQPAGLPVPPLDHGIRPRSPNNVQAAHNSVFIYSPDMAPLILNADMETTYRINGFAVLFHMNNFKSICDVEVEVHESARNDLPGLLATEMDGGVFRRYFDPTQRVKNIEALSLVIK